MELVIKRKNNFLVGIISSMKKNENILYEEKLEIKESAIKATMRLKDDYLAKCSVENDILTVIDPYFLKTPSGNDSKDYADRIISLLEVKCFDYIQIITNKVDGNVKNKLESYFNTGGIKKLTVYKGIEDFHDRFYICHRRDRSSSQGIVVGTSFNSIGNKIYLVNNLSEENINDIEIELGKINHTISPDLS